MEPAKLIREARREAGISQERLARRAGTSQATISAYERGSKEPSVSTLSRLLAAMGQRLEMVGPESPRRPARMELARRGKELAEVLALAEALPTRRRGPLDYPRLDTLRGGAAQSPGR